MSTNYAKVKTNKWASDDDAGDLLAGILDETESAAKIEQSRLEAEMRAKEAEERQRREDEERKKAVEAEQRLNAEQSRQQQLKQRRTERMEAIRIEELKERGEWVDPAIEEGRLAQEAAERAERERQQQMEQQMRQMQQQMQQMAQAESAAPIPQAAAPQKSSKGPLLALAAVLFLLVGAGAVLAAMMTQSYQPDPTNYAKTTFSPKDSKDIVIVVSATPLPKPEPVAVVEPEPEKKSSSKRRSSSRKSSAASSSDKKSESGGKKPKGKFNISDDDLFGGGF